LSFNERVLQEAADPQVPLIERIRFLGIFSNNRDEFFKVRVASLKRLINFGKSAKRVVGDNPKKVLNQIQETVMKQQQKFEITYQEVLRELEKEKIFIINEKQLNAEQATFIKTFFQNKVLPVISPVMLHNVKNFPYLKDKSIYLSIKLMSKDPAIDTEYAMIEIPTDELSRFLVLPSVGDNKYLIILDDVIRFCLNDVFSIFKFDHYEAFTIKMTRDAELDIDNDLSKSFIEKISKSVKNRKQGQPVRFVFDAEISADMLKYLTHELELDSDDNLIPGGRYHNFKDFMGFPAFTGHHLVYVPAPPLPHKQIKTHESILEKIDKHDIMLHVPYHKFSNFINVLREAAIDPGVESISITLYRVARNSKVINALINALRNGKKVTVVIELQARFDEDSNIYWSKKLEEEGAIILFGIKGLKIHAKLCLITRKKDRRLHNYAILSTGNFHEGNARVYTDVLLLTADRRITSEVKKVFDFFEHTYKTFTYKHLLVSPLYMRRRIYSLIDNEIQNAKAGKEAWIMVKINNIVDTEMVKKLYEANNAGVKMKMIVRGICSLVPGIPGQSENIEVISIVDRYLEHARIFVFCNNQDELYYISSADWMTRNLDHRVEVACPVYDPDLQKEIKDFLDIQFRDNVKARLINDQQDNQYIRNGSPEKLRSQEEIYNYYRMRDLS
jgi:polyphosphate kinase